MSLNQTPNGERLHISLFGRRNAGKSSLINAITGQNLAIVSPVAGTTTDPVSKAMELLPIGPVLLTDTPGLDDVGELGAKRIEMAKRELDKTDIALIVVDSSTSLEDDSLEAHLMSELSSKNIPYIVVKTKADLSNDTPVASIAQSEITVSSATGYNINELKNLIGKLAPKDTHEHPIVKDIVNPGDIVILVIPIDAAAPKGRLILPQQQTLRELLEADCLTLCVKPTELSDAINSFKSKVSLVITDSQAFEEVAKILPSDIPLTSFSILMAKHKGTLLKTLENVKALDTIEDGDNILISEGCTHHRQCGDIGTQKLPAWIRSYTNKEPVFSFTSGKEFPREDELSKYKLILHCGGCMLGETEVKNRYSIAHKAGVPVVNYGIAISHMNGILERSTKMLF